jgi:hypothetical protein
MHPNWLALSVVRATAYCLCLPEVTLCTSLLNALELSFVSSWTLELSRKMHPNCLALYVPKLPHLVHWTSVFLNCMRYSAELSKVADLVFQNCRLRPPKLHGVAFLNCLRYSVELPKVADRVLGFWTAGLGHLNFLEYLSELPALVNTAGVASILYSYMYCLKSVSILNITKYFSLELSHKLVKLLKCLPKFLTNF